MNKERWLLCLSGASVFVLYYTATRHWGDGERGRPSRGGGGLASSGGLSRDGRELASSGGLSRDGRELASSGGLPPPAEPLWNRTLDFEALKFSNDTGNPSGEYLVPNFVHFIHFGGKPLRYVQLVCVLSVIKNQRPERLYFHYDNETTFTGKYWGVLYNTAGVRDQLRLNKVEVPTEVFGQEVSAKWRNYHGSDIMRIRTVMRYGGVYLDNDCYVVRSLDDLRRFEIAVSWPKQDWLGSQVIVAHRDARFLRRWMDSYRQYDQSRWYWNAGEKPTVEVLYKEPHLIHRVKDWFGTETKYVNRVFSTRWAEAEWRSYYVVHILSGWLIFLGNVSARATYPVEFDEANVADYPVTFRDMAYDVYDTAGVDWPKNYND